MSNQPNPIPSSTSSCQSTSSACGSSNKKFDWILWGSLISVSLLAIGHISSFDHSLHWLHVMQSTTVEMIASIWWGVLLGAFFVGLLGLVSNQSVMALFGQNQRFKGLLRATFAGLLLDLCSHGILMVAAKLYRQGVSAGQMIAFLLSSPWNSFSLTFVLIGLIGWQWTLAMIALSMLIALITGWLYDWLVEQGTLPANPNRKLLDETLNSTQAIKHELSRLSVRPSLLLGLFINGLKESRTTLRWLLFGILLASVVRAVLSPEQFEQYFGATLIGLMISVSVATVLEVCSEGSAPLAADIFNKGQAPGNGFAFLMAGVSTDYTEMMVLKDTAKSWKFALFLPLLSLPQIILIAWLINQSVGGS